MNYPSRTIIQVINRKAGKYNALQISYCRLSFTQSKTGNHYCAELLPPVKKALESYLADVAPLKGGSVLFYTAYAPFQPLSRGAVWSIVSRRVNAAVDPAGRHQGAHAMRSSLASGLIADDTLVSAFTNTRGNADLECTRNQLQR